MILEIYSYDFDALHRVVNDAARANAGFARVGLASLAWGMGISILFQIKSQNGIKYDSIIVSRVI